MLQAPKLLQKSSNFSYRNQERRWLQFSASFPFHGRRKKAWKIKTFMISTSLMIIKWAMTFEVEYMAYPSTKKSHSSLKHVVQKSTCMLTYISLSCTVQSICTQKSTITLRNSTQENQRAQLSWLQKAAKSQPQVMPVLGQTLGEKNHIKQYCSSYWATAAASQLLLEKIPLV